MLKEETKQAHPFSRISKTSSASECPPRTAREEWSTVHTYEDALKWHIKWTPWFTKDMIEGILKYAYPTEILKEDLGEKILHYAKPKPIIRREESTSIGILPKLEKTISEGPSLDCEKECGDVTPEDIQKRFNRFFDIND